MKKILPLVLVAVVALAAGYFLFGGSSEPPKKAGAESEQAAAETGAETPVEGETGTESGGHGGIDHKNAGTIVDIQPMTMNLADGHFLKMALSLQLSKDAGEGEEVSKMTAKAKDAAIDLYTQQTVEDLQNPEKRTELKQELSETVVKLFTEEGKKMVLGVYVTEFVFQ